MNEYAAAMTGLSKSADIDRDQESIWIEAGRNGDVRAFNSLVLKWEKRVYNIALRMLHNREDAEEAAQETFLLAWRNIRSFRRDAKFSTWLCRIAINHCLTRIQQRQRGFHQILPEENETPCPSGFQIAETQTESLLRGERQRRILDAMARLSPDQRAVIELKFFQEMTFEEIGAALNIPLSTIKSRLYSGLTELKAKLGNDSQEM
jgi:RNA polymerase sigma-70 factor (ECF subfamily)